MIMESLKSSNQRKFLNNYKIMKLLEAHQKVEAARKGQLFFAMFGSEVGIGEALEKMSLKRKTKALDESMALARSFEDELNNTRVDNESLLMIFNKSSHESNVPLILEPAEPFTSSKLICGNPTNEMLKSGLYLPQTNLTLVMAVHADTAQMWIVSEDLVAGPLKFNIISQGISLKKELMKRASHLYPGCNSNSLMKVIVSVHQCSEWLINVLEEEKIGKVRNTLVHDLGETTLEGIVERYSEDFRGTKIQTEQQKLREYFAEVEAGKGNTTVGGRSTGHTINNRFTKHLLVSEKIEFIVFVMEVENKDRIILRGENENIGPQYHEHQIKEKLPFLVWLRKNIFQVKGSVVLISLHTELGRRLERECQGIGAILDARRDLEPDED